MNESGQIRPAPAIFAAAGAIGISTVLYLFKASGVHGMPVAAAPILAVMVYTGMLMLWGKLDTARQWILGICVMLGVHAALGLVTGVVYFFARPSVGQTESLYWALIGYAPSVILEIMATIGICNWIPKLMDLARPTIESQLSTGYQPGGLSRSLQATAQLRAEMVERVSTASREVAAANEQEEPIEEPVSAEELLSASALEQEPEFSFETAGRRYRVMDGKLVEDDEESDSAYENESPLAEVPGRVPLVARQLDWEVRIEGEPEMSVPVSPILSQIPEGGIRLPMGESGLSLRFPLRMMLAQLPEGSVWAPADKVLEQLPPEWLTKPADEIAKAVRDGYFELPLKEIVELMPEGVFALPNQKPAPDLPGEQWGTLFQEAAWGKG